MLCIYIGLRNHEDDRKFAYSGSVAGLSSWRSGFTPALVRVGFYGDKVTLGQIFLLVVQEKAGNFHMFR
jgi:hypothetical protein